MDADFKTLQAQFAAYIRDPEHQPLPADTDPQRMAMYRELFFNNINGFLSSNFPVLRKIINDDDWQALAKDFYLRHRCRTPHFSEIAEEFLDYLQNERHAAGDFPFLLELAHYEWVEMALSIAKDAPVFGDAAFVADVLQRQIVLSPLAWPLAYQYPVQRIGPDYLPSAPPEQATYLIVYRDLEDEVHFMQATPLVFRMLQLLEQSQPVSGSASLAALVKEMSDLDPESLNHGASCLTQLAEKGIIIPADAG
ncbi:MAG: putative DNA-binding domain-containing protein [Methylomonas sp.]|nr:putative DNA-binding domain-containing protein [Methylomonas sp.]